MPTPRARQPDHAVLDSSSDGAHGGRRSERRRSSGSNGQKRRKSSGSGQSPKLHGKPSWESKWEKMEADLMELADDVNEHPILSLNGTEGIQLAPPAPPPDPGEDEEEAKEAEQGIKSLEEFFDSQDYASLGASKGPPTPPARASDDRTEDEPISPLRPPQQPTTPVRASHDQGKPISLLPPLEQEGSPRPKKKVDVGSSVQIFGLTGREDLNGKVGQVIEWVPERARWRVQMDGQADAVHVKGANLLVLDSTHASTVPTYDGDNSAELPAEMQPNSNREAEDQESEESTQDDANVKLLAPAPEEPEESTRDDANVKLLAPVAEEPDESTRDDANVKLLTPVDEEPDVATVLAYDPNLRLAASAEHDQCQAVTDLVETKVKGDGEETNGGKKSSDDGILYLPVKGVRCMWRLWRALLLLSLIELALITASAGLDLFWSPCREKLGTCLSIHEDDCSGVSCKSGAPLWAPAWPLASLIFTAMPLRKVLLRAADFAPERRPRPCFLWLALLLTLAVIGVGASALAETLPAGLHYAARCPMERSASRCEADLCPTPPCRRNSIYSPCSCGRLDEQEMARALFLHRLPTCHPYEWYPWQMTALDELVDEYENFACVFGPIICAALAVGVLLLLVQLLCCPLLLFGRWGMHQALILLFAPEEQRVIMIEVAPDTNSSKLPAPEQVPPQSGAV